MEYYLETYFPNIDDEEIRKNEKKKISNFLKKMESSNSVFKALPLKYMSIKEQAKLIHFFFGRS